MSFSFFQLLFLLAVLLAVYLVHPRIRKIVLLAGSILFCCHFNVIAPITLSFCTVLTYVTAILIGYLRRKFSPRVSRAVLAVFILLCIAAMSIFKIFPSLIIKNADPRANYVLEWLFWSTGFSYYMFQAISYLADVQTGRIEVQKNFFDVALYMTFFPKIASGPIERAGDFIPQISSLESLKIWDLSRISKSTTWILYGFFMKTLLADRIGMIVAAVFDEPSAYNSLCLVSASLLYTLQIYLDFAGYSAVAIGVAALFDLKLSKNFDAPYLSRGFGEFWRRWHITLGSWLRDYIYIPLGGNRKGKIRKHINTMIVFLLCGIWHGSGGGFIIWGLYHGCFTVLDDILKGKKFYGRIPDIVKTIITFFLVSFAWIFFGAKEISTCTDYMKAFLTNFRTGTDPVTLAAQLDMNRWDLWIFIIGILVVFVADIISYRKKKSIPDLIGEIVYPVRLIIIYLLIMILIIFGMYGSGYDASNYIYMRF